MSACRHFSNESPAENHHLEQKYERIMKESGLNYPRFKNVKRLVFLR